MIVDCFGFCNEKDILEIRLETLSPLVDKFIIVEAELTQTLKLKPLYFEENKERFSKYLDKIIHVKVLANECPSNEFNLWEMENFQRNQIKKGLSKLELDDNDVVLIGDCDEIPNPIKLERVLFHPKRTIRLDQIVSFVCYFNCYYLNLYAPLREWVGTVATPYWLLNTITPQYIRNNKDYYDRIEDAGWHFSYCFGGYQGVWKKYFSTIEPLDKNVLIDKEKGFKELFEKHVIQEKHFLYIDRPQDKSVDLKILSLDKLPVCVQNNQEHYRDLLLGETDTNN